MNNVVLSLWLALPFRLLLSLCLLFSFHVVALKGDVSINEVMASNSSTIADEDGDFEDWIELYNAGSQPVDLAGWALSDSYGNPWKWRFPEVTVGSGAYLLIWASGKDRLQEILETPLPGINCDFEEDKDGASPPSGWNASGNHQAIVRNIPSAPSGSYVVEVVATDPDLPESGEGSLQREKPDHVVGERYRLSFWVRSIAGVSLLRFSAGGDDGEWEVEISPEWEKVEVEYESHSTAGTSRWALAGAGTFQMDKVRFQRIGLSLHTNFSIKAGGEELTLYDAQGVKRDEMAPREIPTDISVGRKAGFDRQWFFFAEPTPGAANLSEAYLGVTPPPRFSHAAGFYADSFELTFVPDEGHDLVYARTDGAPPWISSDQRVDGPILVRSREGEPNLIANIPTTLPEHGWQEPLDADVPKASVIRAMAVMPGYIPSEVVSRTFFVGLNLTGSLPVFSLVTDAANFFDPDIGIYVPGSLYDGVHWSSSNYAQSGREWERPVHIEFFEDDGRLLISQDAGVRVQGNATRYRPAKSLRLYARNSYGTSSFEYPFFGDSGPASFQRFLLRPSGQDDHLSMLRDGFMTGLGGKMGLDVRAYRPAVLFLNGEYWGIHNIRENLDDTFFYVHHGVPEEALDRVTMISDNLVVQSGSMDHYLGLLEFVAQNDLNEGETFAQVEALMDVDNYIDYYCAQIFFDNRDWPRNNIAQWRVSRPSFEPGAGRHDGRWRWILWDTDRGWGIRSRNDRNGLTWATEGEGWDPGVTFLFESLLGSREFGERFVLRFADHLNTTLHPRNTLPMLEIYQDRIASEMPSHIPRWKRIESVEQWEANIERMRNFGRYRPDFQRQHIVEFFSLSGISEVRLDVSDARSGLIRINTLIVDEKIAALEDPSQPYPWTGIYFHDIPVEVEALPKPGFRFAGWQGRPEMEPLLRLTLHEDVALTAIFEPDQEEPGDWIPTPHYLSAGPFRFSYWSSQAAAGTYPAHMILEQTQQKDPGLNVPMDSHWGLPYNLASRSRINGLGEAGIAFINTSNAQEHPDAGFVGSAILALNTLDQENIQVVWTGGTVAPNSRPYAIRLQYRLGEEAAFIDLLDDAGQPVEYVRHPEAGHSQVIGPISLPLEIENQDYVQLRWKYYSLGGGSGPRAQLRLGEILVTSGVESFDSYGAWVQRFFSNPADADLSAPGTDPYGEGIPNLLRYALEISAGELSRKALPQVQLTGERLALSFRRDALKTDLVYLVQASRDLIDWSEILYDSRVHLHENNDGQRMRVVDSTDVTGADGRRFLRLVVILNE